MSPTDLPAHLTIEPTWSLEPQILLEDGPLLAIWKPAGLLTQGVPEGLPTLENWVKNWIREKYAKPGNVYLGIPHRLDRPVSGVMLFARNSKAAARLAEVFRDRRVKKIYTAVVEGVPPQTTERLTHYLLKDPQAAHSQVVAEGTPGSKSAILDYRLLGTVTGRSLLEIQLQTGRMHQIRVQMAAMGCPVVGDQEYQIPQAGETTTRTVGEQSPINLTAPPRGSERIALHASRIIVPHPIRFDEVTINAPFPAEWASYWPEPAGDLAGEEKDPEFP
ncbi:RluA family pseudouridine synthase [Planctopirus hydrillae]|uniref:RNA pseudouridine synthase n=1 Tax=Planctopirus hydrillae TaxID=1841610 RepID=A0A1C3E8M2_9PLAN|nr:RNA pseudouridine synthase [Planctopirus hydrillae]ODA29561.1 RNA pseudouridine synthase [Planctopirus hydrillae]